MEYIKKIPDNDFKKFAGKHFDKSWYTYVIDSNQDGYYVDSSGVKKVLFKFRKNKINKSLQDIAISSFLQES